MPDYTWEQLMLPGMREYILTLQRGDTYTHAGSSRQVRGPMVLRLTRTPEPLGRWDLARYEWTGFPHEEA